MSERRATLLVLAVVLASGSGGMGCGKAPSLPLVDKGLDIAVLLGGGGVDPSFARVLAPQTFEFPADHGPHPDYRTEWWYFTGNLSSTTGRRFGYQFTVFRNALGVPGSGPTRSSRWATQQLYMGNFALSEVDTGRFHAYERFDRGALALAGAQATPFRVWIGDWSAESEGSETFPLLLRARKDELAVDLRIEQGKAIVLQGDRGFSRKGPEPGQASFYYSLTRMPTRGTISLRNEAWEVEGLSWMDREWSTSVLSKDQTGWDWFALQLSNGGELMYYQLRKRNGEPDSFSAGTWVGADGSSIHLARSDIDLQVTSRWKSPIDGRSYPASWTLRVPSLQLALRISPKVPNQELNLAVRYWEGAVSVDGTEGARTVSGNGYVELTGYGPAELSPSRSP